jgi:hypothetical protein
MRSTVLLPKPKLGIGLKICARSIMPPAGSAVRDSGTLYLPNNLDFSTDAKGNASVGELHIDGPSKAWQVADGTVGVVTSVATIMSFTPLAPVAAPIAIAGGTYLGVRAATRLADMAAAHGQSWLSKEGMLDLSMVATSALPLAAGSFRLVGLLRSGMSVAPALRTGFGAFYFRNPLAGPFPATYAADAHLLMADGGALFATAKGLDMASMTIGTPLMVESGYDTAVHWNEMSGFDKFQQCSEFRQRDRPEDHGPAGGPEQQGRSRQGRGRAA